MQPRNYFTDAAEWFLGTNPEPKLMSSEEHQIVKAKVEQWVKNGICFTLPLSGMVLTDKVLDEKDVTSGGVLRPPYPVCILEYLTSDKHGSMKVIVIIETEGDTVYVDMMSAASSGGIWTPPAMTAESVIGSPTYTVKSRMHRYLNSKQLDWPEGRNFMDDAKLMLESMALRPTYEFLYALDHYRVGIEDIAPPDRLNRKRLKRGRLPLFTYKVLTIGKKKRKSQHLGGTHASPRSHLRRGYYRTSPKGVRHWVQPCMVKGETDGFVHKDYRVEGDAYAPTDQLAAGPHVQEL